MTKEKPLIELTNAIEKGLEEKQKIRKRIDFDKEIVCAEKPNHNKSEEICVNCGKSKEDHSYGKIRMYGDCENFKPMKKEKFTTPSTVKAVPLSLKECGVGSYKFFPSKDVKEAVKRLKKAWYDTKKDWAYVEKEIMGEFE